MLKRVVRVVAAIGFLLLCGCALHTHLEENEDIAAVAKLLPTAQLTLQQGLTAAEPHGQAISGEFDVEDGRLELSVHTAQGAKYFENEVDSHTGFVRESDPISDGDDLSRAKSYSEAMARAKKSLKAAVDQAEQQFPGYRAIGVTPKLENGASVALVRLLQGTESKTISVPLE